jgi:hypothetical protein
MNMRFEDFTNVKSSVVVFRVWHIVVWVMVTIILEEPANSILMFALITQKNIMKGFIKINF